MVSESPDLSIIDPTMIKNKSKDIYHVKRNFFWTIISIIMGILIVLLILTIYFGVNQKRSLSLRTMPSANLTTTSRHFVTTERTILSPPVKRIPTNVRQEKYRLRISPNLTSETFTGLS